MEDGLLIQIELDRYGLLLIACRLIALPMGRYRNDMMRAALKFNGATSPWTGTFGYSEKLQELILFIKLDPHFFSPQEILANFPTFIQKAKQWTDAITKNQIPTPVSDKPSSQPSGLFGLIS